MSGSKLLTKVSRVNGSVPAAREEQGYWKSPYDGLFHVGGTGQSKQQQAALARKDEYRVPANPGTFG